MPITSHSGLDKDLDYTPQDKDYMRKACLLCDNSTLEIKTGCLIVSIDNKILGRGWNYEKDGKVIHAELSALKEALLSNSGIHGCLVYVSRFPCINCSEKLVAECISKIFYMSDHFTSGNSAIRLFNKAGISVVQIPEESVW